MFAVVNTGGRQHKVQEGEYLVIDHRTGEVGDAIDLGPVLLVRDDKGTRVGDDAAQVKVTA
ncbi:MAG: 50S ribosomal protein L21, partial [Myxococcales bacterium]|nr:50S ribosomal protein L21 [Myxococcales bacterium]